MLKVDLKWIKPVINLQMVKVNLPLISCRDLKQQL